MNLLLHQEKVQWQMSREKNNSWVTILRLAGRKRGMTSSRIAEEKVLTVKWWRIGSSIILLWVHHVSWIPTNQICPHILRQWPEWVVQTEALWIDLQRLSHRTRTGCHNSIKTLPKWRFFLDTYQQILPGKLKIGKGQNTWLTLHNKIKKSNHQVDLSLARVD